jgi:hypothetical protein
MSGQDCLEYLNILVSGNNKDGASLLKTGLTIGEPLSYTIEVFTKEGIDVEEAKNYISEKTGMMPSIHDNGTHYVTNQRLTLEMLKEICDSDDVVDVRGSYCGGAGMRAAYYERRQ